MSLEKQWKDLRHVFQQMFLEYLLCTGLAYQCQRRGVDRAWEKWAGQLSLRLGVWLAGRGFKVGPALGVCVALSFVGHVPLGFLIYTIVGITVLSLWGGCAALTGFEVLLKKKVIYNI